MTERIWLVLFALIAVVTLVGSLLGGTNPEGVATPEGFSGGAGGLS